MFFFSNIKLMSIQIQSISIHSIHFHGFKVHIKKFLVNFNPFSFAGTRIPFPLILRSQFRVAKSLSSLIQKIELTVALSIGRCHSVLSGSWFIFRDQKVRTTQLFASVHISMRLSLTILPCPLHSLLLSPWPNFPSLNVIVEKL